jgi:hypothetical protein
MIVLTLSDKPNIDYFKDSLEYRINFFRLC